MYIGGCCYWYTKFPATMSSCNRNIMTRTVALTCEVQYRDSANNTNVEVNWYRSTNEKAAGIEGERLNPTYVLNPLPEINDTVTIRLYFLEITQFDVSDIGYYWCQIVVNTVSLPPSPYGYIHSPDCVLLDVTCNRTIQPLCALNITSRIMAHTSTQSDRTSCTLENLDSPPVSRTDSVRNTTSAFHSTFPLSVESTTDIDIIKTMNDNDKSARCDFSQDGAPCAAGAVSAAATVVIAGISLILVFVCLTVVNIKFKKTQGKKENNTCNIYK